MYYIFRIRHFYGGARPPRAIEDSQGSPIIYDDLDGIIQVVDELGSAPYILLHGEASRPQYLVVPVQYGDRIVDGRPMDDYDWDDFVCPNGGRGNPCGECSACLAEMAEQDIHYLREHEVYHS